MRKTLLRPTVFACSIAVVLCVFACFDTPYKEGRELYTTHCESCHGDNGVGLLALIPPVAGSDYLHTNRDNLPCIILNGLEGQIEVNGRLYDGAMQGVPYLKPAEVTNLLNYIYTAFGNNEPPTTLPEVEAALKKCSN